MKNWMLAEKGDVEVVRGRVALVAVGALSMVALAGCGGEPEVAEPDIVGATKTIVTTTASEEASAEKESVPDCSQGALDASPKLSGLEFVDGCEGNFAVVAQPNSDMLRRAQWNGKHWEFVEPDGTWEGLGMAKECYNPGRLESMGVPESLRKGERTCGVYGPGEAPAGKQTTSATPTDVLDAVAQQGDGLLGNPAKPACDGRNILIIDSIIDNGDFYGSTMYRIFDVINAPDPTGKKRQWTNPGHCPSLRAQVDGQDIYPVFLDFGSDVAGVCDAAAKYGGNPRILSNRAEYLSPC